MDVITHLTLKNVYCIYCIWYIQILNFTYEVQLVLIMPSVIVHIPICVVIVLFFCESKVQPGLCSSYSMLRSSTFEKIAMTYLNYEKECYL